MQEEEKELIADGNGVISLNSKTKPRMNRHATKTCKLSMLNNLPPKVHFLGKESEVANMPIYTHCLSKKNNPRGQD